MSSIPQVLVVDDDASIREFVSLALVEDGWQVAMAPDGAAALEMIGDSPPDLILLDMRMPNMDGWEFSRTYRRRPGPHAPIVVLSASWDAPAAAAEIAADGVLAKPFDLGELLDLLDRFRGARRP